MTNPILAAWKAFKNPSLVTPHKYTSSYQLSSSLFTNDGLYDGQLARNIFGSVLAYQTVVEVKSALDVIAENIATVPLIETDASGNVIARSDENPDASKLITSIIDVQRETGIALLSLCAYWLKMPGMAFIEIASNDFGYASGLRYLNPQRVNLQVISGKIQRIDYSEQSGEYRQLHPSRVIILRDFNPADDIYGYGATLNVMGKANAVLNFDRAKIAYYRNGMQPGMVVNFKQPVSPDEAREYIRVWNEGLRGVDQWFAPHFSGMPADITYPDMLDITKPMEMSKEDGRKILMGYRVPPEMVGDTTDNPYQFSPEKRYGFMLNVIQPILNKILEGINIQAAPLLAGNGHKLIADFSLYEVITETEKAKQDMLHTDWQNGRITYNEYRVGNNYAPVAGGDFVLLPKDKLAIPLADMANAPKLLQEESGQAPVSDAMASVEIEPEKGAVSLSVMLSLANDPDLVALQKRLKTIFPEAVKWLDPSEFHITLLSVPSIEDSQIADVIELLPYMRVADMQLRVGSLMCFDNVGEHALHFRIGRNSNLLDIQHMLYEACQNAGVITSGHSKPERYIPHITMGYLPEYNKRITYQGKVLVEPQGIVCSVERDGEYETVYPVPIATDDDDDSETVENAPTELFKTRSITLAHDNHTHEYPIVRRDGYSPEKALDELSAWYKFIKNGKGAKRAFEFVMLRGSPADQIIELQAAGKSAQEIYQALKSQFDGTRLRTLESQFTRLSDLIFADDDTPATDDMLIKAIGDLEVDFIKQFNAMLTDFRSGKPRDKGKATAIMRVLNDEFVREAFEDGLISGGVNDDPDEDDRMTIRKLISEANAYVSDFIGTVYGDGISDAQADLKAGMWWKKSIMPAYYAGYDSAKSNAMMQFVGEDGDESCETCKRLKNKKHRLKWWIQNKLRPQVDTDNFDCGGWQCRHYLIEVT